MLLIMVLLSIKMRRYAVSLHIGCFWPLHEVQCAMHRAKSASLAPKTHNGNLFTFITTSSEEVPLPTP